MKLESTLSQELRAKREKKRDKYTYVFMNVSLRLALEGAWLR